MNNMKNTLQIMNTAKTAMVSKSGKQESYINTFIGTIAITTFAGLTLYILGRYNMNPIYRKEAKEGTTDQQVMAMKKVASDLATAVDNLKTSISLVDELFERVNESSTDTDSVIETLEEDIMEYTKSAGPSNIVNIYTDNELEDSMSKMVRLNEQQKKVVMKNVLMPQNKFLIKWLRNVQG